MEKLKNLEEICEPDSRRIHSVVIDETSGDFRPLMLKDIYSFVEQIRLRKSVPKEVRSHFEMARNLYLYSWFYYPFNVAAQLYSFVTVEFALKNKFDDKSPIILREGYKKPDYVSFRKLLKKAVEAELISDEGFSQLPASSLRAVNKSLASGKDDLELNTYCEVLKEIIPYFRNELAHGSDMLHNQGGDYLIICAELINQLFYIRRETARNRPDN